MKFVRPVCALLAVATLALGACEEGAAASESAKSAAASVSDAVKDIDWSKLSPDALADKATGVFADIQTELGEVKDSETAKKLVAKYESTVDQIASFGSTLAGKWDASALKTSLDNFVAKFKDNPDVMKVVQPLIDKLRALFN